MYIVYHAVCSHCVLLIPFCVYIVCSLHFAYSINVKAPKNERNAVYRPSLLIFPHFTSIFILLSVRNFKRLKVAKLRSRLLSIVVAGLESWRI